MIKFTFNILSILLLTFAIAKSDDIGLSFSPVIQLDAINKNYAMISGAEFGVNISKQYYLGLFIFSNSLFKHQITGYDPSAKLNPVFEINYYGIETEYYLMPSNMFHVSVSASFGVSNISFTSSIEKIDKIESYFPDYRDGVNTLIIKPAVNLNLSLKDYYKIVLGISYRYFPSFEYKPEGLVNQVDNSQYIIGASDLNGFAISFGIRFGSF